MMVQQPQTHDHEKWDNSREYYLILVVISFSKGPFGILYALI